MQLRVICLTLIFSSQVLTSLAFGSENLYEMAIAKYQIVKLKSNLALRLFKIEKHSLKDPKTCLQKITEASQVIPSSGTDSQELLQKKIMTYDHMMSNLQDLSNFDLSCAKS